MFSCSSFVFASEDVGHLKHTCFHLKIIIKILYFGQASPKYYKLWPQFISQISECKFAGIHQTVLDTHTLGTHSRTVLSLDAEPIKCPDGENFTDSTASCQRSNKICDKIFSSTN